MSTSSVDTSTFFLSIGIPLIFHNFAMVPSSVKQDSELFQPAPKSVTSSKNMWSFMSSSSKSSDRTENEKTSPPNGQVYSRQWGSSSLEMMNLAGSFSKCNFKKSQVSSFPSNCAKIFRRFSRQFSKYSLFSGRISSWICVRRILDFSSQNWK